MALEPQELKIYADELNTDGVTGIDQRRDILDEEFRDGLLRGDTASAQIWNSILNLLTLASAPHPTCIYAIPTTQITPSIALDMNGTAINSNDNPNLFEVYGATLPNITAEAPTGFKYIVRNS